MSEVKERRGNICHGNQLKCWGSWKKHGLVEEASFDIADWFEVKGKIEKVADPSKWHLEKDEKLVYVPVNLTNFYKKYGKTVRKNISVPEYLANWAKENKINVSRVASDALKALQEQRA